MSDVELLGSVLSKEGALIDAVPPERWDDPTPCPDYSVRVLMNHMIGWLQVFSAGANGRVFDGDPAAYVSDDPGGDFQVIAAELLAGWRAGGVERTVRLTGPELPGSMVLSMTLMECLTHACDLAVATAQPVPFTDAEITVVLDRATATLPDQYRGEGKPFAKVIDVPQDAPALARFLGFMGRRA